jgi:hypothetical protein
MEAKKPVGAQKQREIAKSKPRGKPFEKGNQAGFKPGQSGNPGGLPKGTPKIKVAYMNLLAMEPEKLSSFQPMTLAELLAVRQLRRALGLDGVQVKDAINATEKIADRAEGRATEHRELTGKDGKPLFENRDREVAIRAAMLQGLSREQAEAAYDALEAVEKEMGGSIHYCAKQETIKLGRKKRCIQLGSNAFVANNLNLSNPY